MKDSAKRALKGADFLSLKTFEPAAIELILSEAERIKSEGFKHVRLLANRSIGLLFEKPSTRTRASFEVAVVKLGGHPMYLSGSELQVKRGETLGDTGKVLSRYIDGLVVRTFGQDRLEEIAAAAEVPVINALTDECHPCQALADMLTISEYKGGLEGVRLAYVGDGNNVCHSLMRAGTKLGMAVAVATPPGREPLDRIVDECKAYCEAYDSTLSIGTDALKATADADVIYTDVWVSMGDVDTPATIDEFVPYRVDSALVENAADDAIVMHCLPAHRGEEITDEVLDGSRSVVWDQAENRLYAQAALLALIYGE